MDVGGCGRSPREYAEVCEELAKADTIYMRHWSHFLRRLRSIKEADGTLLDRTLLGFSAGQAPIVHYVAAEGVCRRSEADTVPLGVVTPLEVKLLDFGVAKDVTLADEEALLLQSQARTTIISSIYKVGTADQHTSFKSK